jgi:hypothetical protein
VSVPRKPIDCKGLGEEIRSAFIVFEIMDARLRFLNLRLGLREDDIPQTHVGMQLCAQSAGHGNQVHRE